MKFASCERDVGEVQLQGALHSVLSLFLLLHHFHAVNWTEPGRETEVQQGHDCMLHPDKSKKAFV